ncbi:MAG TPA: TolC family protein [Rariglobus sp.]|jgi:TolC family type I secretion outer membrane protein|nr:TolC family protein [Rariglobus sp.]
MKTPRFLSLIIALLTIAGALHAAGDSRKAEQPLPNPIDLKSAISYALQHNYNIRLAREAIREQEGLIVEVEAQILPNVSANASYSKKDDDLVQGPTPSTQDWTIAIQVRQAIYAGGGIKAAIDAQGLVRDASLLNLKATINNALLDVRTKFFNILLARDQIKVQEENIALLNEQLRNVTNRFKAGTVSNFDVLQAEVQLANAQPTLITARNTYRTSLDQLRQSLGAPASLTADSSKTFEVEGTLQFTPAQYDLNSALESARANRPELLALSKTEQAQQRNIRLQKAGYLPTVDLVGGYEWIKKSSSNRFRDSLDGWTIGAEANWAIFDGRATAGRVMQARSQYEQARLNTESQTLGIDVEVRQAYSSLQEADELVQATLKTVDQAKESLRLATARFNAGTATQLDVLTSQVALSQARLNELQANYNYNVALASMRKAIGQGDVYAPVN